MTDQPKNAIAVLTLESLAFLQRKKDEVEALVDTTTRTDELVVYLFLIEKLRNDTLRDAHMVTMSHRLDEMQRQRKEDHEIVAACLRDNAATRRMTIDFGERVEIIASQFPAIFDRIAEVAGAAEKSGKQLEEAAGAQSETSERPQLVDAKEP